MILSSESARDKNRAQFPFTSQVIDELRAVFGDGVAVQWAEENGKQIGQRGPDGVKPNIERRVNK